MQSIGISRIVAGAAVALAVIAGFAPAQAQDDAANYPNKPIRVIVPFAAGGGNDIFARLVGNKLAEILGQQLVIENRPAAGGRPAAEFVTNQPADGYTLFVGASGVMSVASAVYPKLAYHPTKSFIPLSMIADFPLIMVSPVENPAKTVAELVAYRQGESRQGELRHHVAGVHDGHRAFEAQDRNAGGRDPAQVEQRDDPVRDAAAVPASRSRTGRLRCRRSTPARCAPWR